MQYIISQIGENPIIIIICTCFTQSNIGKMKMIEKKIVFVFDSQISFLISEMPFSYFKIAVALG